MQFCKNRDEPGCYAPVGLRSRLVGVAERAVSTYAHSEGLALRRASNRAQLWLQRCVTARSILSIDLDLWTRVQGGSPGVQPNCSSHRALNCGANGTGDSARVFPAAVNTECSSDRKTRL